jgi:hypothetical protein
VARFCEHGDELSGPVKYRVFLEYVASHVHFCCMKLLGWLVGSSITWSSNDTCDTMSPRNCTEVKTSTVVPVLNELSTTAMKTYGGVEI